VTTNINTIAPGATIGHWLVLATNGRRAACRCRCGVVREVSVDALLDGTASPSCGCVVSQKQATALREEATLRQRQRELRDRRPSGDRT
jgi:hypothetical protein